MQLAPGTSRVVTRRPTPPPQPPPAAAAAARRRRRPRRPPPPAVTAAIGQGFTNACCADARAFLNTAMERAPTRGRPTSLVVQAAGTEASKRVASIVAIYMYSRTAGPHQHTTYSFKGQESVSHPAWGRSDLKFGFESFCVKTRRFWRPAPRSMKSFLAPYRAQPSPRLRSGGK